MPEATHFRYGNHSSQVMPFQTVVEVTDGTFLRDKLAEHGHFVAAKM
jgi:hypothetical protein